MSRKEQIKGIFFDFDGVITVEKYGTPTMVAYISEKTGLSYDKVDLEYRKYNKDLLLFHNPVLRKGLCDINLPGCTIRSNHQLLLT